MSKHVNLLAQTQSWMVNICQIIELLFSLSAAFWQFSWPVQVRVCPRWWWKRLGSEARCYRLPPVLTVPRRQNIIHFQSLYVTIYYIDEIRVWMFEYDWACQCNTQIGSICLIACLLASPCLITVSLWLHRGAKSAVTSFSAKIVKAPERHSTDNQKCTK